MRWPTRQPPATVYRPSRKCKTDAASDLIITGMVPPTSTLLDGIKDSELQSLRPEHVVPYLKERLHRRVTLADRTEHPRDGVNTLKVIVLSTEVTLPTDQHSFPTYSGEYQPHHQVAEGRPGGYNHGDVY
ncbi:MAG: hypothetical protein M1839_003770 [Geoglossum umbratile]|nr:MAG: hypothetical protein M1839_003770 [Geoglossum umbratile]